jgi:hypothetical protein
MLKFLQAADFEAVFKRSLKCLKIKTLHLLDQQLDKTQIQEAMLSPLKTSCLKIAQIFKCKRDEESFLF